MTPSWPRLAGRLATARVATLQGRWRYVEDGRTSTGTFAHRAPDDWATFDEAGALDHEHSAQRLGALVLERGEDYHRPAGPVRAVEHAGRPCWEVALEPPAHKSGLLVLTVDDATGLCLRTANPDHGFVHELLDVVVDEPVDDAVLAPLRAEQAEHERMSRLYRLHGQRPVPTPRWFPWRRGWDEGPGLRVVEFDGGTGSVGRAPLGEQAAVEEWLEDATVHRFDHGGWSWAVASEPPVSEQDARRVVEQVTG